MQRLRESDKLAENKFGIWLANWRSKYEAANLPLSAWSPWVEQKTWNIGSYDILVAFNKKTFPGHLSIRNWAAIKKNASNRISALLNQRLYKHRRLVWLLLTILYLRVLRRLATTVIEQHFTAYSSNCWTLLLPPIELNFCCENYFTQVVIILNYRRYFRKQGNKNRKFLRIETKPFCLRFLTFYFFVSSSCLNF